jgi:hypothetical protein
MQNKIRFNLSRGENYMKWKVEFRNGWVRYYDPATTQIVMSDCTLKNNRKAALSILSGSNKFVCAWVLCKTLEIKTDDFLPETENKLKYNPRELPFWNLNGKDVDSSQYKKIISVSKNLFVL